MTQNLGDLVTLYQEAMWHGFLVFLRVGAVMAVLPAFGEQSVPVRVKLGLAMCFTAIVVHAVPNAPLSEALFSLNGLVRYVMTETVNGLIIGLGFRLFVLALQTAGVIAAQALSLSQILGGAGADPMPALGQVLVISGLALAVMAGLHVQAAKAMVLSYSMLPLGQFPLSADLSRWGVAQIARSFWLSFTLAAPFLVVSLLYNLTLGVINRAMPQLMVAFIGAPAITLAALVLMMLLAPFILMVWLEAVAAFANNPLGST